ncbi:MAG: type II toxin-antitoxin system VapB family antitoxin [Gammaproteobacteria bacterium]
MSTNLAIDDNLINKAVQIGHHRTKKAAVTTALIEYIAHHEQLSIRELFGSVDYDPHYDYKSERKKK